MLDADGLLVHTDAVPWLGTPAPDAPRQDVQALLDALAGPGDRLHVRATLAALVRMPYEAERAADCLLPRPGEDGPTVAERWRVRATPLTVGHGPRTRLLLVSLRHADSAAGPAQALLDTTLASARLVEMSETVYGALDIAAQRDGALDAALVRRAARVGLREAGDLRAAAQCLAELASLAAEGHRDDTGTLDIADILYDLVPAWQAKVRDRTFELAVSGPEPRAHASAGDTARALDLLLECAAQVAGAGSTVRVALRAQGDAVRIALRAQGMPLTDADAQHIFDPFHRPAHAEGLVIGGGLGLPLARALIEAHGGRIGAEVDAETGALSLGVILPLGAVAFAEEAGHAVQVAAERETPHVSVTQPAESVAFGETDAAEQPVAVIRQRGLVLVLETDARMARYIRSNVEAADLDALTCAEGDAAFAVIEREEPDVLLLDSGIAEEHTVEYLLRLRRATSAPVLVLARRPDPLACARLLDAGAADYIAKPFSTEELLARVRAALRAAIRATARPKQPILTVGAVAVDVARHLVTVAGEPVPLSKTEFRLLRTLAEHPGMVLSHETLLERVWGPGYAGDVESLWVYIRRLRRKIEADPKRPSYVRTVPGVGYKLERG